MKNTTLSVCVAFWLIAGLAAYFTAESTRSMKKFYLLDFFVIAVLAVLGPINWIARGLKGGIRNPFYRE